MKITSELLRAKGACEIQVEKFDKLFPDGVVPTRELALKHASDFGWFWAAENLLTAEGSRAFSEAMAPLLKAYGGVWWSLRKAYDEAVAPLQNAYDEVVASLLKVYADARAPLRKAYEEAVAPLQKAYKEAKAPLLKAYDEATALAFVDQWEKAYGVR
jgi:hypothetical protein